MLTVGSAESDNATLFEIQEVCLALCSRDRLAQETLTVLYQFVRFDDFSGKFQLILMVLDIKVVESSHFRLYSLLPQAYVLHACIIQNCHKVFS